MNLHRSEDTPEWELVPPEERNYWQRLAAKTHGIVTPGNIATAAGVCLVVAGEECTKRGKRKTGLTLIATGFAMDFVDGQLADRTETKSRLGAKADIVSDKFKVLTTLYTLHKAELIGTSTAMHILVQNSANVAITAYAKATGNTELNDASALGKVTAVAQAGRMVTGAASKMLASSEDYGQLAASVERFSTGLEVVAAGTGICTSVGYAQQAFAPSTG